MKGSRGRLKHLSAAERESFSRAGARARWNKNRPAALSPEELKEAIARGGDYDDVRNEGRFVYCRLCGKALVDVYDHLSQEHGLSSVEPYKARFPGAPARSHRCRLAIAENDKRWRRGVYQDAERHEKVKERGRIHNRRYHRISGREDAKSIRIFREDPSKEYRENLPYVVCREDNPRTGEPCGEHLEDICKHLVTVHGLPKRAATHVYLAKWAKNGIKPPLMTQGRLQRLAQKLREHGPRRKVPKKRGRQKGWLSPDTEARITVIAACKLQGIKEYQISLQAYPLYRRQADAWKALEQLLRDHSVRISQKQVDLSKLSQSAYKAQIETAERTLRSNAKR